MKMIVHIDEDHAVEIETHVDQQARNILVSGTLEEMGKLTKEAIMLQACIAVVNSYHTLNIDVHWELEVFTVENEVESYVVPFTLQAKTD